MEVDSISNDGLSFVQIVKAITDFIETAIHTILYIRDVYPPDLFIRRKRYNAPIWQSRHPLLNEYVTKAMKAIAEEMKEGAVQKVILIIKNGEDVAMERFIFSLHHMLQLETWNRKENVQRALTAPQLGEHFRSFLLKLSMVDGTLDKLDLGDNGSFSIVIELKNDAAPKNWKGKGKEPSPWISANNQHTTRGTSERAELHMIRAVDTGLINISLAVQETQEKLEFQKQQDAKEPTPEPEPKPQPSSNLYAAFVVSDDEEE